MSAGEYHNPLRQHIGHPSLLQRPDRGEQEQEECQRPPVHTLLHQLTRLIAAHHQRRPGAQKRHTQEHRIWRQMQPMFDGMVEHKSHHHTAEEPAALPHTCLSEPGIRHDVFDVLLAALARQHALQASNVLGEELEADGNRDGQAHGRDWCGPAQEIEECEPAAQRNDDPDRIAHHRGAGADIGREDQHQDERDRVEF